MRGERIIYHRGWLWRKRGEWGLDVQTLCVIWRRNQSTGADTLAQKQKREKNHTRVHAHTHTHTSIQREDRRGCGTWREKPKNVGGSLVFHEKVSSSRLLLLVLGGIQFVDSWAVV